MRYYKWSSGIEQDQNTNEKLKFDLGTKLVKEMLPSKKT